MKIAQPRGSVRFFVPDYRPAPGRLDKPGAVSRPVRAKGAGLFSYYGEGLFLVSGDRPQTCSHEAQSHEDFFLKSIRALWKPARQRLRSGSVG